MNYNNFRIQIAIRLMVILIFLSGLSYYLLIELNVIRAFFFVLFTAITTYDIYQYIIRSNNETSNFLTAILNNDFSNKYSKTNKGTSFYQMYDLFNQINERFSELNIEREGQYLYIQTLVEQIKVGILSFDRNNHVLLVNQALLDMLDKPQLPKLEDLGQEWPELYDLLEHIPSGTSELIKITVNGESHQLSIGASEFILRGKYYKLISLQDIQSELDINEMQAWQKLIRVLTHEIMNSVAPIASLSETLHGIIAMKEDNLLSGGEMENMVSGLDAIRDRSTGLMKFAEDYRSLMRIPAPRLKMNNTADFINNIRTLFNATILDTKIKFSINMENAPEEFPADPDLMTQVLINILKNAKEAIQFSNLNEGLIEILVSDHQKYAIQIDVTDNGGGIEDEDIDKIFVPFYTNKVEGTGIGLSVVKQIVNLHKGSIHVESKQRTTCFQLLLPG